jgi:hypothetical protein
VRVEVSGAGRRREGTAHYHQTHIALHELAHMLLNRRGATQVRERLVNLLAPDLDP